MAVTTTFSEEMLTAEGAVKVFPQIDAIRLDDLRAAHTDADCGNPPANSAWDSVQVLLISVFG